MFSQKGPVWFTVHTDGNFAYLFKSLRKNQQFFIFANIFVDDFRKNTCWEKIRENATTHDVCSLQYNNFFSVVESFICAVYNIPFCINHIYY